MEEAFVLIRVQQDSSNLDPEFMNSVKKELAKVEGVKEVKGVFGIYDFVAIVQTETTEELGKLVTRTMKKIKGVVQTDTMIVGF
jgi:DNA-binding Lrp family transcriptional regulator